MSTLSKHLSALTVKDVQEMDSGERTMFSPFLNSIEYVARRNTDFHDEQNIPTWPSEETNLVV